MTRSNAEESPADPLREALEIISRKAHIGTVPDAVSPRQWFQHIHEFANAALAATPPPAPAAAALPPLDVERDADKLVSLVRDATRVSIGPRIGVRLRDAFWRDSGQYDHLHEHGVTVTHKTGEWCRFQLIGQNFPCPSQEGYGEKAVAATPAEQAAEEPEPPVIEGHLDVPGDRGPNWAERVRDGRCPTRSEGVGSTPTTLEQRRIRNEADAEEGWSR